MIMPRVPPPASGRKPTERREQYLRRVKRHLAAYQRWIERQVPVAEGAAARDVAAIYALSELVADIDDRLSARAQ